jgi:hypothetical protein
MRPVFLRARRLFLMATIGAGLSLGAFFGCNQIWQIQPGEPGGGGGPPTFVTVGSNTPSGTSATTASALLSGAVAGGWIVGFVAWFDDMSPQIASVTDTAGNTYTFTVPGPSNPLLGCRTDPMIACQQGFYAPNVALADGGTGDVTVTVTMTSAMAGLDLRVAEYSNLAAFEYAATNTGNSTLPGADVNGNGGIRWVVVGAAVEGRVKDAGGVAVRMVSPNDYNVEGDFAVPEAGTYPIWFYEEPPMGLSNVWVVNWLTFR